MLRKLIIVYNPRSSHYLHVQREVLAPARQLKGWLVGKYELKPTDVDDNAEQLAKLLNDGDLVVAAGGDGTASVAVNGVMQSGKDVVFSALGYGNFNDVAKMLGIKRPVEYGGDYVGGVTEIAERFETKKVTEVYPLEAKVDGKLWRYAPCYVTLGMFAESAAVLNSDSVRKKLRTGKKHLFFSLWQLAKWYFANRKQEFLPKTRAEVVVDASSKNQEVHFAEGTTDYLAVNSPRVAKMMRGSKCATKKQEFRSTTARLGSFWRLVWFMLRSVLVRIPGKKTIGDVIKFDQPSKVMIHAEGEYQELTAVSKIEIKKSAKALKVIKF